MWFVMLSTITIAYAPVKESLFQDSNGLQVVIEVTISTDSEKHQEKDVQGPSPP